VTPAAGRARALAAFAAMRAAGNDAIQEDAAE
jgi:hypothetical protein